MSQLFERVLLRERTINVDVRNNEFIDLDTHRILNSEISDQLTTKMPNNAKEYLGDDFDTIGEFISKKLFKKPNPDDPWDAPFNPVETHIILDENKNVLGFVGFQIDKMENDTILEYIMSTFSITETSLKTGDKYVEEIYLMSVKPNQITIVRDVLRLLDEQLNKYGVVMWSVNNDNPIKKAYDRYCEKHDGHSYPIVTSTRYMIEKKQS